MKDISHQGHFSKDIKFGDISSGDEEPETFRQGHS